MANRSQSQDVEHSQPEAVMSTPHTNSPADVISDAGAFAQKIPGAAAPSRSMLGRVVDTAAAAKAGARLLPPAWRLFKRYPLSSSLIIVGLVSVACLFLADGASIRKKPLT